MFKPAAIRYYAEDEMSDVQRLEIQECWKRAERAIGDDIKDVIRAACSFHDWYITECSVYCQQMTEYCKMTLHKKNSECCVLFTGVSSISITGDLISNTANYPGAWEHTSFAQVLDFWMDYQRVFECCWLLDSERFIIIEARAVSVLI